jgi:hypothetical protein
MSKSGARGPPTYWSTDKAVPIPMLCLVTVPVSRYNESAMFM